jgi:DNA-binding MarR family transcriptional regulator
MTKKQEFIEYVENLIKNQNEPIEMSESVRFYWEALKAGQNTKEKPLFTDNGKLVLQYMKDNLDTEMWKSKDIAEGLFVSSRTVSGAFRKLVSDGFVEKVGENPTIYTLTEDGKNIVIE